MFQTTNQHIFSYIFHILPEYSHRFCDSILRMALPCYSSANLAGKLFFMEHHEEMQPNRRKKPATKLLTSSTSPSGWCFQPLWKIWVRQLGWLETQYMEKHVPNHQSEHLHWLFVWMPLLYWTIVIISQQGFSSHCSIGNIKHPLWRRPRFFQRQVDKLGAGRSTLGSSGCRRFRCPNKMKVNVGI